MKLIFSRKGFDSGSGGGPSPIIDGVPVTLPIPGTADPRAPTYAALGLGEYAERASRGRVSANDHCHHDPFFADGRCAFGQADAAQSHLERQGVGPGDVFLFFGLFDDGAGSGRHHRIFAAMTVDQMLVPSRDAPPDFAPDHPHFWGEIAGRRLNAVYVGPARRAARAHAGLCLSAVGQPLASLWDVPDWLWRQRGLSYHGAAWRWAQPGRLRTVGRGQEFVTDISGNGEAQDWLGGIVALIERD